ncbi:heavy metal sensor histidine kinase [Pseudothauera nasutitermitis]|uniref:Sensor protein n=1 Tax=Pseudothauera nasutitermitis TaxID=2565930 RepID=A0A4S4APQ3_9RHOO|nr:heavy metal sensor histidine kinase [Pseudothauera nasutitermitis]THF61142.1 heavy metal sensor histidine kinase [Pseudothauera nasutitermitis]
MSTRAPLSLTARLAWLFALVAAGLLLIVGVVLGRAVEAHFDELDRHDLSAKLAMIGNLVAGTGNEGALAVLPRRLRDALTGHDNVAVLLRDADGEVVFAGRAEVFDALPATPLAGDVLWTADGQHYIGRERTLLAPLAEPLPLSARVALDITHHAHFLAEVRARLWVGISLAAALAALLGWLAARQGLAPLARVTATARRLSAERLGERIAAQDAPAEVRELAEAFNGMLDRLESSFRRLSEFSADLAHELRTPVSNLMTETQVALARERDAAAYREVLASNLEEFDRLARMVGDMLFLAQADNGLLPRPAETVELADEAAALAEFYEALAEERGVRIECAGRAAVRGDRLMLRRALSNLLSNALRHTPVGGVLRIAVRAGAPGEVALSVTNPGEPIPPEQLERIFERFHRADPARSRGVSDGTGLGLAITRSIAEAHGGRVSVRSAAGETAFTLHLPASGGSSEESPTGGNPQ